MFYIPRSSVFKWIIIIAVIAAIAFIVFTIVTQPPPPDKKYRIVTLEGKFREDLSHWNETRGGEGSDGLNPCIVYNYAELRIYEGSIDGINYEGTPMIVHAEYMDFCQDEEDRYLNRMEETKRAGEIYFYSPKAIIWWEEEPPGLPGFVADNAVAIFLIFIIVVLLIIMYVKKEAEKDITTHDKILQFCYDWADRNGWVIVGFPNIEAEGEVSDPSGFKAYLGLDDKDLANPDTPKFARYNVTLEFDPLGNHRELMDTTPRARRAALAGESVRTRELQRYPLKERKDSREMKEIKEEMDRLKREREELRRNEGYYKEGKEESNQDKT
jgi:hypothetical protein